MRIARIALIVALTLLATSTVPVVAQDTTTATITGRLVHGADDPEFDPTRLAVTLNVLEGISAFDQESVVPDEEGNFSFEVASAETRTFFLGVEYQGARYSETRSAGELGEPVLLTVYDTTHDTSVLEFSSYSVIVAGAVPDEGWIEIIERASVFNDSGKTLIPDPTAEGPAMLSFLRFALPPNFYNLDVRSNLVGGDILQIDRGFALTTPVVPTSGDEPHLFEFVYRLDYDSNELDLSRTMRFGATSFRYVAAADVGRPISDRLDDLGATELNGRFLRLLEGQGIAPGEAVVMSITGLPTVGATDRLGELAGYWYVRMIAPAAVVVGLAALFGYFILSRRNAPRLSPNLSTQESHDRIVGLAEVLEARHSAGQVSERRYIAERSAIKQALIDLRLREQRTSDSA